jgi:natural product biosynthesis luciferase-like monooxygenase protein
LARRLGGPFDFFFSITNFSIVPAAVLALAKRAGINFHDGPLPRYAGFHATTWAILRGETRHGISWHLMEPGVDEGDLLKQRFFPIDPGETCYSLNTKCYEAAIATFTELVDDLAKATVRRIPQDLNRRTYFGRYDQPEGAGVICWDRPATEIVALVRALDFGRVDNPLCTAKVLLGTPPADMGTEMGFGRGPPSRGAGKILSEAGFLIASSAEVVPGEAAAPGTVLSVTDAGITIAAAEGAVAIRGLRLQDGQPLVLREVVQWNRLSPGARLPVVAADTAARWAALNRELSKHERYWIKRLGRLDPLELPGADRTSATDCLAARWAEVRTEVYNPTERLSGPQTARADVLLSAVLAYLAHLTKRASFTIGFRDPKLADALAGGEALFAVTIPLVVEIAFELPFALTAARLAAELAEVRKRGSFARDVSARYPSSPTPAGLERVIIEIASDLDAVRPPRGGELAISVAADGLRCRWLYDTHLFSAEAAEELARGFEDFLKGLGTTPDRPLREQPLFDTDQLTTITLSQPEAFWRETLRGFTAKTPLPASAAGGEAGFNEKALCLSAESTAAMASFAHSHGVTLSTLVHAGWALALGVCSGEEDVVFGVQRSCHPPPLAGGPEMACVLRDRLPLRVHLRPEASVGDWLKELSGRQEVLRDYEHVPLADIQRWSEVPQGSPLFESSVVFTGCQTGAAVREKPNDPLMLFAYDKSELLLQLVFDRERCSDIGIERCLELLGTLLEGLPINPDCRLSEVPLTSGRQRQTLMAAWNATSRGYAQDRCIHELFEEQVERTPGATAVVFRNQALIYRELNRRANQLARRLQALGAGPGKFVGLFLKRSLDLVVAMLATLKAGAAYVPMDPSYPSIRLAGMLEDTNAAVVLTQRDLRSALPSMAGQVVCLDEAGGSDWRSGPDTNVASGVLPRDLAYVIFTSGSSGRPKGVMVEHRNVSNYFSGMDDCLDFKEPGTWLAVTSISFDISVQELLWTLTRGFKVVLQEEPGSTAVISAASARVASRKIDFSLCYFAADCGEASENRYRLLTEGARFADQHGFAAVWTPERHFHAFGGLYPNPSLTSAVIAALTSRVQIRAGSVVLPLHNPIRVAEEWSVVDNLSHGRVGLSFASGWHANDFALMPQNYSDRKAIMLRGIDTIRRLWRGESVEATSGTGDPIHLRLFPSPVQREPPIWLTSAGNVETFQIAARMGFNVLTNLLGQEPKQLAEKIAAYRAARRDHGHPGDGHVTLMLHTFVGPDLELVRHKVRTPFLEYLKTSTDLIKKARWEFPAFPTSPSQRPAPGEDGQLSDAEMQAIMDHAFERYFQSSGLFGTPEMCLEMIDRMKGIGVDEIACLIDFGVDSDSVLESLRFLNEVRERSNPESVRGQPVDHSIPTQLGRHGVTHLQCTPTLAQMLASELESLRALRPLRKLLIGGEALPPSLAAQLAPAIDGDLINVYGPTETTIWSTAARIDKSGGPVTIGRPLANTQVYIVDRHLRLVPIGVPGELCIGGQGVARGYLNRPELTDERFVPDLFGSVGEERLYRTGDLARYREDGRIEYLGRLDHQVKIRGHRIELGEIEAVLTSHPSVRECVVVAREQSGGHQTLCAYVAASPAAAAKDGTAISWRELWDATYDSVTVGPQTPVDPTLNTSGWISSYTGQPIPEPEMRQWAEHTVARILALKPRRVLEIGCGTGMLLFRIAPHCEQYHGVDFSVSAIRYVQTEMVRQGLRNVTLLQAAADDLHGLEPRSFDVVVINSVIQYFPSADYLVGVLERATPLVEEGGTILVGDVRSLPLHEAFHTSVVLEQAPDALSAAEVRYRTRQRLERDDELVLDPRFFRVLPQQLTQIRRVQVHLKRGRYQNELTRFRYDVFLGIGGPTELPPPSRMESGAGLTLTQIRERLASGGAEVAFTGIPNPRVARAVRAAQLLASDDCPETAGAIRRLLSSEPEIGVDPEDLYTLDTSYGIELNGSQIALDRYDAVFRQRSAPPAPGSPFAAVVPRKAWNDYTNRRTGRSSPRLLAIELKEMAKERLPEFMVPATIILMDALPRTPNGKVNRKALPQPGSESSLTAARYVAPENELERTISSVWRELLQLERVGIHDNFFDIGANSLLMVQANSRLRAALRRDLSLVDLFRYPTVNALAQYLNNATPDPSALVRSQDRGRARLDALQKRRTSPRSDKAPL